MINSDCNRLHIICFCLLYLFLTSTYGQRRNKRQEDPLVTTIATPTLSASTTLTTTTAATTTTTATLTTASLTEEKITTISTPPTTTTTMEGIQTVSASSTTTTTSTAATTTTATLTTASSTEETITTLSTPPPTTTTTVGIQTASTSSTTTTTTTMLAIPTSSTTTMLAIPTSSTTTTMLAIPTSSTSAIPTTTTTPTSTNFTQIIDMLGPRKKVDVVFILSRSQSIGKRSFYEKSRYIMRSLIQLYSTVHANFTRVAVISYSSSYTIDYNDISGNSEPKDKCQLFPSGVASNFPLDSVKYVQSDDKEYCGIYGAFSAAGEILKVGKNRRNDAVQIVVLISDALVTSCSYQEITLSKTSVKVFGVTLGAFRSETAMSSFVSDYKNYGAEIDSWLNITEKATFIKRSSTPIFVEIKENVSCGETNEKCFCNIDDGSIKACNSAIECTTPPNPIPTCQSPGPGARCEEGTCFDVPYGTVCQCRENFYGQHCQNYSDPCRFSGICEINGICWGNPINGGQFKCNCTPDYIGDFCQDLKPTTATTPPPRNVTRIQTIVISVTPIPIDGRTPIILGSVFGGLALLAIIIGIILIAVCCIRRRKIVRNANTYGTTKSTTTGVQSTLRDWSDRSKIGTMSTRLSQLFGSRRSGEGFPTVPNRFTASLWSLDMQNVSHEETVFRNEVIQDNRQILKNWKAYLDDLTKKEILTKAVMANLSTKDAICTEKWNIDWNELNTLEINFGLDMEARIQNEEYTLRVLSDDFMCGEELFQAAADKKFACVGRTKKYLIVGIGKMDAAEESRREIQLIGKHIKAEGF